MNLRSGCGILSARTGCPAFRTLLHPPESLGNMQPTQKNTMPCWFLIGLWASSILLPKATGQQIVVSENDGILAAVVIRSSLVEKLVQEQRRESEPEWLPRESDDRASVSKDRTSCNERDTPDWRGRPFEPAPTIGPGSTRVPTPWPRDAKGRDSASAREARAFGDGPRANREHATVHLASW